MAKRSNACFQPLETRRLASATLVSSFGSGGQLIGAQESSGAVQTLIPYSDRAVFQFTGGDTLTRLLSNGKPDTRFAGIGSIDLGGRNPIEAIAAAPDGGAYVEYGLTRSGSTTVSDIGIQHFTKTGRLDTSFGSHHLLDLANFNRSATTFAAGPMVVSSDNRLYLASGGTLYSIPDNGSVAGVRTTASVSGVTKLILGRGGAIYSLGDGVSEINRNFQLVTTFGTSGTALSGETITDGAFDSGRRLVVTISSTASPQLQRLTALGAIDQTFGSRGTVTLPLNTLPTGTAFSGSHLVIDAHDNSFVAGGVSATTGTTTTSTAALLEYDRHGKLVDKQFSSSASGTLSSEKGTLEGGEVDVALGPSQTVYVSSLIDQTSSKGTAAAFDFIEQFALKPFGGV